MTFPPLSCFFGLLFLTAANCAVLRLGLLSENTTSYGLRVLPQEIAFDIGDSFSKLPRPEKNCFPNRNPRRQRILEREQVEPHFGVQHLSYFWRQRCREGISCGSQSQRQRGFGFFRSFFFLTVSCFALVLCAAVAVRPTKWLHFSLIFSLFPVNRKKIQWFSLHRSLCSCLVCCICWVGRVLVDSRLFAQRLQWTEVPD